MKLYEITGQYTKLDEMLGEVEDGGDAQAYHDLAEWITDSLENKVAGICAIIRNNEAEADAIKLEIDRLTKKRKAMENKAQWLKDYLLYHLQEIGQEKVKAGLWSVAVKDNPPSVLLAEDDLLPDEYYRVKKEPDLVKIKADLKAGISVPYASLFSKKGLTIK